MCLVLFGSGFESARVEVPLACRRRTTERGNRRQQTFFCDRWSSAACTPGGPDDGLVMVGPLLELASNLRGAFRRVVREEDIKLHRSHEQTAPTAGRGGVSSNARKETGANPEKAKTWPEGTAEEIGVMSPEPAAGAADRPRPQGRPRKASRWAVDATSRPYAASVLAMAAGTWTTNRVPVPVPVHGRLGDFGPNALETPGAVRLVNQTLAELKVEQHPDKTFIGGVRRGFDFRVICYTPAGLEVAPRAVARCVERVSQLYQRGADLVRIGGLRSTLAAAGRGAASAVLGDCWALTTSLNAVRAACFFVVTVAAAMTMPITKRVAALGSGTTFAMNVPVSRSTLTLCEGALTDQLMSALTFPCILFLC